jgi:ABC-2 type transport system permease protein
MSALSYILLLNIASIPLQSIAFLLGGLSFTELVVGQLLLAVTAVAFALYGLYCSSIMRTTLASSVATFGGTLFAVIGFPLLILLIFWASAPSFSGTNLAASGNMWPPTGAWVGCHQSARHRLRQRPDFARRRQPLFL